MPSPFSSSPSPIRKILLSGSFIFISVVYIAWQHISGSTTVSLANTSPLQSAATTQSTPGQSYQAANEALLQTIAQITGSSTPQPSTTHSGPTSSTTQTPPSSPTSSATPPPTKTPAPAPKPVPQKPAGQYTDGSYTGSAADAYYGTVQIQVVIRNGQLADVKFLQYPNTHSTSVYINSQAMPLLTQEAIQAQNANVSGVSGATFTSQAFQQSLAQALTLAKA